jgi:hypothetical protein
VPRPLSERDVNASVFMVAAQSQVDESVVLLSVVWIGNQKGAPVWEDRSGRLERHP